MKNTHRLTTLNSLVVCSLFVFFGFVSCQNSGKVASATDSSIPDDFMYQYSIIDALLAGAFDGNLTIGELRKKGDFGVGTFNRVDGELIIHEGIVYRVRYDGSVATVPDTDSTSAAFVKTFKVDTTITMEGNPLTYDDFQKRLSAMLNPNGLYALRVSGDFDKLTARAPGAADEKPYPTLSEHLKTHQALFNFTKTSGTCMGFLLPIYLARTNVPGYHFHYLANDKKTGGHVFAFETNKIQVEIDYVKGFVIENNTHADFTNINLQPDRGEELKKIE
jgi:acetolactate decarboxylase